MPAPIVAALAARLGPAVASRLGSASAAGGSSAVSRLGSFSQGFSAASMLKGHSGSGGDGGERSSGAPVYNTDTSITDPGDPVRMGRM